MVLEDSQDNAEVIVLLLVPLLKHSFCFPWSNCSASARFPRSMVASQLRDKPKSNNLDKILALVSTQLLQKVETKDNIPMQMQMQQQKQLQIQHRIQKQQQQQQQQNMMNIMMMSIMSSKLNHGISQTTTSTIIVEPTQAMMNSMIASNVLSMQQSLQSPSTTTPLKVLNHLHLHL